MQGYVDDHRLILYRDGQAPRDITAFITDLQAVDDLNALAVEVSFTQLVSPWDKYVPRLGLGPGDKLRISNHGVDVFAGQVEKTGLDGTVTAYDRGWYLNKSQIILQCMGLAADEAIRRMAALAGVPVGKVASLPQKITQLWTGDTPAEILEDILSLCSSAGGKEYKYYVSDGALQVEELGKTPITAYHKPAENIAAFDITWALGQVAGEDSIGSLRNAVVIAAEEDGKVYIGSQAKNTKSIQTYGFLQQVETITDNPGTAQLEAMARNLLAQGDRIQRTRTVSEIWGCDEVKSGVVLQFNSPAFGLSGAHRVTRVTHHYGGAGHTMELELTALDEPRAAGENDTVQVYGLPASIGASSSSGGDGSAAAFVAVAAGEVGYREQAGNRNKYGAWAGNDGVAWCAYFICWCADQADAPIPRNIGSVSGMRDYFQDKGLYRAGGDYIPQPGDLMVQKNNASHIGIVESADAQGVRTIEGNCSDMVRRMTRRYSEISGFCTPWG